MTMLSINRIREEIVSTVNVRMGNRISYIDGRWFIVQSAFEILSKNALMYMHAVLVVEAIAKMCDGEILQEEKSACLSETIEEDYYKRVYQKQEFSGFRMLSSRSDCKEKQVR